MTTPAVSPVDRPAYTAAEVGRLLSLPPATVRAWFFGVESSAFRKVLRPADAKHRLLSFGNLCEAHILATIRRVHNVPMARVRRAIQVLAESHVDKPILNHRLLAERGRTLLLDAGEAFVDIGQDDQLVLKDVVERAVARIEWDDRDTPVRLFPFPRQMEGAAVDRVVAIDPRVGFGRPIVARAGVTTTVVFDRFSAGDKMEELAADLDVSVAEIEEAIRFESRLVA